MINSLWGDDFNLVDNTDEILKKSTSKTKSVSLDKQLASDSLSLEERLSLITENVYKILGKQKNRVVVIKSKQHLHEYIDAAIEAGVLALDTETNNTLDYLNCKLVGPCLYVPDQKQAYIPINHVDPKTNERLDWQVTEKEFAEELQRAIDAGVKFIFHNYKFDYQVIKMTCGIEVPAYWDTMIGTKMINELDKAGLKPLYIKHFDHKQQKYDIEHLFNAKYVKYVQVEPDVFALYAATDSMMTYKLFKYQEETFSFPSLRGMYKVFREIEMPIIKVVAEMELEGIGIDFEYAKRLSAKYHKKQDKLHAKIEEEFKQYLPQIEAWKQSKEANEKPKKYATAKQAKSKTVDKSFPYEDKIGRYKLDKSKAEQLEDPLNLDSPTQLAILLFDILKFPEGLGQTVDDTARSTGSSILEILAKDYGFKLGEYLSEKKTIDKLISTFIDPIPTKTNPYDNKIHTSFNQLGAIARFSSGGTEREGQRLINLQNIPSSTKEIRPMFKVDDGYALVGADLSGAELRAAVQNCQDPALVDCYNEGRDLYSLVGSMAFNCSYEDACEFYQEGVEVELQGQKVIAGNEKECIEEAKDNVFIVPYFRLVETTKGFIPAQDLTIDNILITDEGNKQIKSLDRQDKHIIIEAR